jgi:predicted ester cyclase
MSDESAQVVRRYYDEVFGRHNVHALEELIAPGFTGYSPGYGPFGIEDMRRSIARERADMPDDETIVEEQIASGERVVTRWRYRWKHDVSVFGETPTGEWLELEGVHFDRVINGKIVDRWEIKDVMGVVRHLEGSVTFPKQRTEGT